jgi:vitamin B12 transporter
MLCSFALTGQQDTSATVLPAAIVSDFRPDRHGVSVWTADSAVGFADAADQLRWSNALQLRSIGPGLLSTPSIRGAGAARTPVFWKGINLQSPMNGVSDLSLVPLWPGDQMEIRQGGQSAALSSGAMSGSVQIQPAAVGVQPGLHGQTAAGIGSFGAWYGLVGLTGARAGSLRASWVQAENNFPFVNTARIGAPIQRQQNNQFRRLDLQHHGAWRVGNGLELESAVWGQRALRAIPPAMTEAPAESWQQDEALRAVFSLRRSRLPDRQWQQQLAILEERIVFSRSGDADSSASQTALWRGEWIRMLAGGWTWRGGAQAQFVRARADGYADTSSWQTQARLALTGALEKTAKNWKYTVLLRQEWAEAQGAPFSWSAAVSRRWKRNWSARGQFARNFTLPTFNDRFWQGLGKADLKPERGYSAQVFLEKYWTRMRWEVQTEAGVFHLLLDDWILWQPGADGLFRPDNLRQVWSRGLEWNASATHRTGNQTFRVHSRFQYLQVTNTRVYGGSMAALNKQLPYTPQLNASVEFTAALPRAGLSYIHQWTGRRFTTSDNSLALPGFHTGVVQAYYRIGAQGRIACRLDNCWNTPYQLIAFRPMPGRNWQMSVFWQF